MSETFENKDFYPNELGLKNGSFRGLSFNDNLFGFMLFSLPSDGLFWNGEGTKAAPDRIEGFFTNGLICLRT